MDTDPLEATADGDDDADIDGLDDLEKEHFREYTVIWPICLKFIIDNFRS